MNTGKKMEKWLQVAKKNKKIFLFPFLICMNIYRFAYKVLSKVEMQTNKTQLRQYSNCWLFCDRIESADDNGEHLYRYVMNRHEGMKIFFLLSKESPDWKRLIKEGFRLIEFGSAEHRYALKGCAVLISSQADNCIVNYFGEHTDWIKKFVFLQHGVTQNDLSDWLNFKNIAMLVTSTRSEYLAFTNGQYRIEKRNVKLLGMPRHDSLRLYSMREKILLIAPTWRQYMDVLSEDDLKNSSFIKNWNLLLRNVELINAHRMGYKIAFYPHPMLEKYLKYMKIPEHVQIYKRGISSIQELIGKSEILITDYSSLAFEMAFLERVIFYYQFDKDEVFSKNMHTFKRGYFDYEKDGFGKVFYNIEDLARSLHCVLKRGAVVDDQILRRERETFLYRDGRNCERVYGEILNILKM